MKNHINEIIAIDGPAGSGKSSLTKKLADDLGLFHIDSGAFYRTCAYILTSLHGLSLEQIKSDDKNIQKLNIHSISYKPGPDVLMLIDQKIVDRDIRKPEISQLASQISQIAWIRNWVNLQLRNLVSLRNGISVMEGRDIGTVIFPYSKCKFFLTASIEVRARRRLKELEEMSSSLQSLAQLDLSYEKIFEEIKKRDHADENRPIAPLKKADDAIEVDTSNKSFEEVLVFLKEQILRIF